MRTRKRQRRFSLEQRKQLLTDYRHSGLRQREYAQQHGLGLSTFTRWLRLERRRAGTRKRQVPLQQVSLGQLLGPSGWAAEVVLPNGATLRLQAQADPGLVEQLWWRLRSC
jgi:hypothetical protein